MYNNIYLNISATSVTNIDKDLIQVLFQEKLDGEYISMYLIYKNQGV